MSATEITSESEYMAVRRAACELEREILSLRRKRPDTVLHMMLLECELESAYIELDKNRELLRQYDTTWHGDRTGGWFPLYSGKRFWPLSPRPGDIDIVDIAHSLARINRFNGHTRESYSVAQHSVLCSEIVPDDCRLYALLHDAAEAYLGDIISPVKHLLHDFEPLEERVMEAVAQRYCFVRSAYSAREVKKADMVLLATEIRDLTTHGVSRRELPELPMEQHIEVCWGPYEAEAKFLRRFHELSGEPSHMCGLRTETAAQAG